MAIPRKGLFSTLHASLVVHATVTAENQAEWRPCGWHRGHLPHQRTDSRSWRISTRRPFTGSPTARFRAHCLGAHCLGAHCLGLQIRPAERDAWICVRSYDSMNQLMSILFWVQLVSPWSIKKNGNCCRHSRQNGLVTCEGCPRRKTVRGS